jgi:DNA repair exonuclease SbcCD nuclease subunit
MTTLILGDLHVWNHKAFGGPVVGGLNRRCRDILQSVYQIVEYAKLHYGVTHVVQLGDFFDGPKPSPQILNASLDMIAATKIEWHIIAGNHDIASYDAPSALAPMNHAGNVHTYDTAQFTSINGQRWLIVPYSGPDAAEALKVLATVPDYTHTYFAVHYGLVNEKPRTDCITPDQLAVLTYGNRKELRGYFGHEHDSRAALQGVAVSCGSLLPLNFSDIDKPLRVFTTDGAVQIPEALTPKFIDLRGLPLPIFTSPDRFVIWMAEQKYLSDFGVYARIEQYQEAYAKELIASGLLSGYQVFQAYAEGEYELANPVAGCEDPESYIWTAASQVETDQQSALADTINKAIQESR